MGLFVLMISLDLMKTSEVRKAGDRPKYIIFHPLHENNLSDVLLLSKAPNTIFSEYLKPDFMILKLMIVHTSDVRNGSPEPGRGSLLLPVFTIETIGPFSPI